MAIDAANLPPPPVECTHSIVEYFFVDPFCKEHGLFVKITVLVFHILTIGIPGGAYHLVVWLVPSWKYEQPFFDPFANSITECWQRAEPLCAQTRTDVEKCILRKQPTPVTFRFDKGILCNLQPINPQIAQLEALYLECLETFKTALSGYKGDEAWEQQLVIEAADNLMTIVYTLAYHTIRDIPAVQKNLEQQSQKPSRAQVLAGQKSYLIHCFLHCAEVYYMVRGGFTQNDENEMEFFASLETATIAKFYQPGTPQNGWRLLFNSLWGELNAIGITEEDLAAVAPKTLEWLDPDRGERYFTLGRSAREPEEPEEVKEPEEEPEEPEAVS